MHRFSHTKNGVVDALSRILLPAKAQQEMEQKHITKYTTAKIVNVEYEPATLKAETPERQANQALGFNHCNIAPCKNCLLYTSPSPRDRG